MTRLIRNFSILTITLMALGFMPAKSWATLIITLGNGSANTVLNYGTNGTTNTVFTASNNQLGPVIEVTVNEMGQLSGGGQASIVPVSGGNNFQTATFSFIDPYVGTEAFELNLGFPQTNTLPNGSSFTVYGKDQLGVEHDATFVITNGENRFNIESDVLQYITGVRVTTAPFSYIDTIQQIRIGALVTGDLEPGLAIPEPSSLALAIGCIAPLAAIGMIRRRRQLEANVA
jgi:hypothetical protein